jgi:hypothetical protein
MTTTLGIYLNVTKNKINITKNFFIAQLINKDMHRFKSTKHPKK